MMRFRQRSLSASSQDHAELDMTPMIDIVFQLIIFFMVSTTFVMTNGLKLTLPSAATPDREQNSNLVISLTQEGGLFVNREPATPGDLVAKLQAAAKGPDQVVILRADENVNHGRVVEAMDLTRQAGLTRIAIATAPVQVSTLPAGAAAR